jgi:hypothetical protein
VTYTDPHPEHTKQSAVLEEADAIGRFLDESGYILAEYRDVEGEGTQLAHVLKSLNEVLAEYFNIDLDKIEAEKREILASLRGDAK